MKYLLILILTISTIGCKDIPSESPGFLPKLAPLNQETIEKSVIYEANIRQYSAAGTFIAFANDLPRLKNLKVKIVWLMPIHPISEKKKKGTLGSPYSVSDFRAVNPDFGSLQDFDFLLDVAHTNGMYVIMDWVANQTGWNHKWIAEHPEYYQQNEKGEIQGPSDPKTGESWGWTDVAALNYNNPELRKAMLQEMLYWVKNHKIDGFRLDMAHNIPADFWKTAFDSIKKNKSDFLFIETEKSEMISKSIDAHYDYVAQQLMNQIANERKSVADWDAYFDVKKTANKPTAISINSTSNHDENTWNGTTFERLNGAAKTFVVLTYLMPGIPMIYNGQEFDNKKRLPFFDKDSISHTKGKFYSLYENLGRLKFNHPALSSNIEKGVYTRVHSSPEKDVLCFWRTNNNDSILFVANLKNLPNQFNLPISGIYKDYFSWKIISITNETTFNFEPWEYKVLIKQ